MTCGLCGQEFDKGAERCPYCGFPTAPIDDSITDAYGHPDVDMSNLPPLSDKEAKLVSEIDGEEELRRLVEKAEDTSFEDSEIIEKARTPEAAYLMIEALTDKYENKLPESYVSAKREFQRRYLACIINAVMTVVVVLTSIAVATEKIVNFGFSNGKVLFLIISLIAFVVLLSLLLKVLKEYKIYEPENITEDRIRNEVGTFWSTLGKLPEFAAMYKTGVAFSPGATLLYFYVYYILTVFLNTESLLIFYITLPFVIAFSIGYFFLRKKLGDIYDTYGHTEYLPKWLMYFERVADGKIFTDASKRTLAFRIIFFATLILLMCCVIASA
ncbi:MAG: hypothetical protein Q4A45_01330 [Clostridia bacterium]|nr:hypothetical protein [Clostridia bacterium]